MNSAPHAKAHRQPATSSHRFETRGFASPPRGGPASCNASVIAPMGATIIALSHGLQLVAIERHPLSAREMLLLRGAARLAQEHRRLKPALRPQLGASLVHVRRIAIEHLHAQMHRAER